MSIKTRKNILSIYAVIASAAGIGFAIYRTILLKQYYDPYGASFEHGSGAIFRSFEYLLLFTCAAIFTSFIFIASAKFQPFAARASTTSISICAICGAIAATTGVLSFAFYSDEIFDFSSNSALYKVFSLAALFFLFLSALYFLVCASTMFGRSKTRAYLSLSLPLFALSYLVAVYFNSDFIFYNSNRITCTVTCVFMMLFLLSEAKLAMGQESYAFHFATALAFIVAGSAYVIPMLALVFFWEINMSLTTMTELSFIGFIIYAAFSAANSVRTLQKAKKES